MEINEFAIYEAKTAQFYETTTAISSLSSSLLFYVDREERKEGSHGLSRGNGVITGLMFFSAFPLSHGINELDWRHFQVWSLVRRFDEPQKYKPFVRRCVMREGGLEVGSVREIEVTSGLPATTSIEQLERLDDNEHILGIRKLGGNHRLKNYASVITLHHDGIDGRPGTTVVESFVVDVPDGNTDDETCCFVEHLIKSNLRSLANVSEQLVHP